MTIAALPAPRINWIEAEPVSGLSPATKAQLLMRAVEAVPRDARLHSEFGATLFALERYAEAATHFERAIELDTDGFLAWRTYAASLLRQERADEALELCDGRWHSEAPERFYVRGRALMKLKRREEGRADLRQAIERSHPGPDALRALLESYARDRDGSALLQTCADGLRYYGDTALSRGYRALGFSLLGRDEDARTLVDLDRCVMRVPFQPPSHFGDAGAFNDALAEAVLADPPANGAGSDTDINYAIGVRGMPHFVALRRFIREAIEAYAAQLDKMSVTAMGAPPEHARLGCGSVVLRRAGRNHQHIHPEGYISTVYHVRVPASCDPAGPAGALSLGGCDEIAPGHRPCWGERLIAPVAGWLTLFPSHVFHDVVPTLSDSPRISIVADMNPVDGQHAGA